MLRGGFRPVLVIRGGVPDAVHLKAGDCFVLPCAWPFHLTSDLTLTPVDAHVIFPLP
jgi:hypothetical protein